MRAGAWVGIAIVYFLAPRVRRIAQYTVPDILEKRYTPAARLLGSMAIIIAYLTIASYQFKGGGRLLNILLPSIDPAVGAAITCGLVVIFTVAAGMLSIVTMVAPLEFRESKGLPFLYSLLLHQIDHSITYFSDKHRS